MKLVKEEEEEEEVFTRYHLSHTGNSLEWHSLFLESIPDYEASENREDEKRDEKRDNDISRRTYVESGNMIERTAWRGR